MENTNLYIITQKTQNRTMARYYCQKGTQLYFTPCERIMLIKNKTRKCRTAYSWAPNCRGCIKEGVYILFKMSRLGVLINGNGWIFYNQRNLGGKPVGLRNLVTLSIILFDASLPNFMVISHTEPKLEAIGGNHLQIYGQNPIKSLETGIAITID